MAAINPPIITFAGGIMGRLLHNRVDVPKYTHGAEIYCNWWPQVQGPMSRRPPLEHVDVFDDSTKLGYQLPFVFSVDQSYNLLGVDGSWKFYTQTGRLVIPQVTAAIANGQFTTSAVDEVDTATVTVSSTNAGAAANLKDNDPTSYWQSSASSPAWITVDHGSAKTIRTLYLTAYAFPTLTPIQWALYGSATGAFAGEEVVLHYVAADAAWYIGERRRYRIAAPGSYRYYRILMYANTASLPAPAGDAGGSGAGGGTSGYENGGGGP